MEALRKDMEEEATISLTVPAKAEYVIVCRLALDGLADAVALTPEILSDLKARPPLYEYATIRLTALLTALEKQVSTADPQLAQQRLHDVLSMSRYDALHRPPHARRIGRRGIVEFPAHPDATRSGLPA